MIRRPQRSTLFPYPTLSRSKKAATTPPCPNHTTSTATSSTSNSDSAYTNHQRYQPRSLMRPSSSFTNERGWYRWWFVYALSLLDRSEEHTSELQSRLHLVCRLLLEKKKKQK